MFKILIPIPKFLRTCYKLIKLPIALTVTFSTLAGYLIFQGEVSMSLFWVSIGIFLLACAASMLNQYQERHFDARMPRTALRPIPSGDVSTGIVLIGASLLAVSGGLVLMLCTHFLCVLLGLFTMLWYNGIYTYLKRKTPFAAVPGALTGAIPPMIGWIGAGGVPTDPVIILIGFFVFLWQIPHFWILLTKYGSEYEGAGFASLTKVFNIDQIGRLTLSWNFSTALYVLIFPIFHIVSATAGVFLIAGSIWLISIAIYYFVRKHEHTAPLRLFTQLNVFFLVTMVIILVDHIIT